MPASATHAELRTVWRRLALRWHDRLSGSLAALLACGIAVRSTRDLIELFVNPDEAAPRGMTTTSMREAVCCPGCAPGYCFAFACTAEQDGTAWPPPSAPAITL